MAPRTASLTTPEHAQGIADTALAMMRGLGVAPTPKHYAVFFACATGQPGALVGEIEKNVAEKKPFSDEFLDHLYNDHIAEAQSRVVQETATNARKILAEMVASVAAFTGSTQNVSQELAHQLESAEDPMGEQTIKLMARAVIESAQTMKQSSESVTERLAGAQKEIAGLRENLAKATHESERDFLTGCFNRKSFDRKLEEAMAEANRTDGELTLLMLDIDYFKKFNDEFGHQIGDEVLKIVSKILTDSVKGMDTVARFGGEEFTIILPKTPVGGGMIVSEGIRKAIAGREFKHKGTGENYGAITVSVGVASFRHQVDTASSLIKRADEALYRSKKAGRNRVTQENLAE